MRIETILFHVQSMQDNHEHLNKHDPKCILHYFNIYIKNKSRHNNAAPMLVVRNIANIDKKQCHMSTFDFIGCTNKIESLCLSSRNE